MPVITLFDLPGLVAGIAPAKAAIGADFATPALTAGEFCGFSLAFPSFTFGFSFDVSLLLGISVPSVYVSFAISCDLSKPIDFQAGLNLPFGGGRTSNIGPHPSDNDAFP